MKNDVQIQSGLEFLDTAYQLIKDTLKRSKLGFMSYNDFERLVHHLGPYVKIFVAEHRGVPQGCAIVPFSDYSAYYLYGGSISKPVTGATNLLQWEAIRTFKKLGIRHYDFVGVRISPEKGSKQSGLKMFKQRFGGDLVLGYMWKYSYNQVKFAIYS